MARVTSPSKTVLHPGTVATSLPRVLVERRVGVAEMLRRIYWDATHRRLVYRDPDTGRIVEIRGIPDLAVTRVTPAGSVEHAQLRKLAGEISEMTDGQLKQVAATAPFAMLRDLRALAHHVLQLHGQLQRRDKARSRTVGRRLKEYGEVVDERTR